MTDDRLIMLEGYGDYNSGLGWSVKKAVSSVTSAVSSVVSSAASAVTSATSAVKAVSEAVKSARTDAIQKIKESVQSVQDQIKPITEVALQDVQTKIQEKLGSLEYSSQVLQRAQESTKKILKGADYTMIACAAISEASGLPIIKNIGEAYLKIRALVDSGMTVEEIIQEYPKMSQQLNNPNAQALIQLIQDPSISQLERSINMSESVEWINMLKTAFTEVRDSVASMSGRIIELSFSIFDYVDNGKLL